MSPRAFSTTSLRPVSWACRRYGSIERTTEISERQPSPSPTWTGCRRHSTRSSQGWGESVGRSPANAMDVEAWSYANRAAQNLTEAVGRAEEVVRKEVISCTSESER